MLRTDMQRATVCWGFAICVTALLINLPNFSAHHLMIGNDLLFHLGRIEGIKEGLLSGQFPVRLNPAQLSGYGMPTPMFYPEAFLYFPAILRLLGVPLVAAWKVFLVFASFLTAAASWWAFSTYARSWRTGAIATLFYLVSFYRLAAMYLSAGVGMLLGLAFLPAAMIAVWLTLQRRTSYWPAIVIFATCIFQSHIITGILFLGAAVLMAGISCFRFRFPEVRWAIAKTAGFTMALNLWFYVPMAYFHQHMDYVMKSVAHENIQLVIYSFSELDCYIGSAMLVLFLVLVPVAAWRRWQLPAAFWILLMLSAGLILLMVSRPPWEGWLGHVFGFLQFPNRFIIFPTFFCALAMGIGLSHVRHSVIIGACVLLCLASNFLWIFGCNYLVPQNEIGVAQRVTISNYMQKFENEIDGTGYRDYMDAATSRRLQDHEDMRRTVADRSIHPMDRIEDVWRRGNAFVIRHAAGAEVWVQLPVFWYPGYVAEDMESGERLSLICDGEGKVSFLLPPSAGNARIWYEGLPWFRVTDGISCLGLIAFLYACYKDRFRWKAG